MNKERLKNLAETRKKAIADEKRRKEAERKRKITDIEKGLAAIDELYRTLTEGSDEGDKKIDIILRNFGDDKHIFTARIKMSEDAHGILTLDISSYSDTSLCISNREDVADAEDIYEMVKGRSCAEWILEHGDEFCEKVMDVLEKQYEVKRNN